MKFKVLKIKEAVLRLRVFIAPKYNDNRYYYEYFVDFEFYQLKVVLSSIH